MRPLLHGDVSCAARALYAVEPGRRAALCRRMIGAAELADRYRERHGRLHPRWGNGSLMAAARRFPLVDEPGFDDAEYWRCVVQALEALTRLSPRRSSRSG